MGLSSRLRSRLGLAAALLLGAAAPLFAQAGTISGRVTDAASQRPLAGAQVQVTGATRSAVTNADGDYTLTVGPGSVTVRASTLGYSSQSRTVTVAAGQATTANFALQTSAISLNELVVTGTPGATEKRELGNSVTTVHAADITDKAPVTNVTQLLAARAPGLTIMQPSGSLGTAAAIRIRGLGSVQAGNAPIFYIDGVRMFGGNQGGFGVGGQTASNLDAINPNDIESIEVIKGPAAATLYGADAAAGVIQIITKKGRSGRQSLQWSGKVEMGNNEWKEGMPTNYTLCTAARIASASWPGCAGLAANTVLTERPLESALETGDVQNFNLNVRGGGERFSFYLSGDREDETGVFVNNAFARTSGRGNFSVTPSDFFDVTGSIAFSRVLS
jgi:TonB-dependent SusC/RagA subfamily outer membrane receptor